jgi:hypothetical protein
VNKYGQKNKEIHYQIIFIDLAVRNVLAELTQGAAESNLTTTVAQVILSDLLHYINRTSAFVSNQIYLHEVIQPKPIKRQHFLCVCLKLRST